MKNIIWRDDDIGFHLDHDKLNKFKEIHELFNKHKLIHTIAVVAKDIDAPEARSLVKYIKKQKNIDIQLHCWEHLRVTPQEFIVSLPKSLAKMEKIFHVRPTVYYPPWNEISKGINDICKDFGMVADYSKISLKQYINNVKGDTVNFHYWADECKDLETALIKSKNE